MIPVNHAYHLILDSGQDLTAMLLVEIQYCLPGTTTPVAAPLPATVQNNTEAYADIPSALNTTEGKWLFRIHANDGLQNYYSEATHVDVMPQWHPWEV